jgi:hypothetical protein
MTTPSPILRFDDSLHALVDAIDEALGQDEVEQGVVLRDMRGLLAFFHGAEAPDDNERDRVAGIIRRHLGPYARADRCIAFADDPGADRILGSDDTLPTPLADGRRVSLVDRRIVGSGWLSLPRGMPPNPPRIVFASVNGGVGRSTALCVAAADFAASGLNVLVVDLDLEAPGIGSLLLRDEDLPEYGALDVLVENGIGGVDGADLDRFVGVTVLTDGQGQVDVVPAFGSQSLRRHPQNVLPKIARAMIEDINPEGRPVSLGHQIRAMIDGLAARRQYDAVFVDARAGLAELTAAAMLDLGATVLLFGTAQRQTIQGYRALLAGLHPLFLRDPGGTESFRRDLKVVLAKSVGEPQTTEQYIDEMHDLFASYVYDVDTGCEDAFTPSLADTDAPHHPLMIKFDPQFASFDPVGKTGQLRPEFYDVAFRPFIAWVRRVIEDRRSDRLGPL